MTWRRVGREDAREHMGNRGQRWRRDVHENVEECGWPIGASGLGLLTTWWACYEEGGHAGRVAVRRQVAAGVSGLCARGCARCWRGRCRVAPNVCPGAADDLSRAAAWAQGGRSMCTVRIKVFVLCQKRSACTSDTRGATVQHRPQLISCRASTQSQQPHPPRRGRRATRTLHSPNG